MKKLLLSLLAVAGAWTSAFAQDPVPAELPAKIPAWQNDCTSAPANGDKFYLYNTAADGFIKGNMGKGSAFVSATDAGLWTKNNSNVSTQLSGKTYYLKMDTNEAFTNQTNADLYARNYTYEFDADGKISIVYASGGREYNFWKDNNGKFATSYYKGLLSSGKKVYEWYLINETQYANHMAYVAYYNEAVNAKTVDASEVSKAWRDKYLFSFKFTNISVDNQVEELERLTDEIKVWENAPQNYALMTDELASYPTITNQLTQIDIVRTIPAGKWNTICIPFDYHPSGWTIYEVTEQSQNGDAISVTVGPSEDGYIKAGKPYVIKPGSDVDCIIANDVTLTDADTDGEILPLVGTYSPVTVKQGDYYVSTATGDLTFKYLGTPSSTLKGFRAYFPNVQGNSNRMLFSVDEGSLTQILDAISEEQSKNPEMYDLNGRRTNALKSGIYVVGGKKVIIK